VNSFSTTSLYLANRQLGLKLTDQCGPRFLSSYGISLSIKICIENVLRRIKSGIRAVLWRPDFGEAVSWHLGEPHRLRGDHPLMLDMNLRVLFKNQYRTEAG
jgi:hypothetical protein